ncbi:VOC family protein [Sphingomonas cannabina]|uniref:VOC family protein n=1 Tax=Sphingomonas cannabina TaxID=2899123 RepID=UPI001F1D724B|nr:VOC family protein [Sphingomonas cannabina]UIJ46878.1 VOC family protein [Sphingomonas cannabina]
MIDHLELYTRKPVETVAFYARALAPLGYTLQVDGPSKGFGDGTTLDLFIAEGDPVSHVHFALAVPDRTTVDRVYAEAEAAGLTLDRAPALAPHIHPNYYAGYLRDPDGRLVEFVCQRPEPAT